MSCSFPSALHMEAKDPPWFSHVKADGSRDAEYYIRHKVMEIHYPKTKLPPVRWKCSMELRGRLMLKRQDHLVNSYYRCVQFVFRSRSIVQILWSQEVRTFDLGLCDDSNLKPDPWPLIWYGTLEDDYIPCPFNGGFDVKIVDSELGENGCNLMLRPMRMEAECLGGEGVTFNFVSTNCLPDVSMYVMQRTICVADWHDSRNHYIILRRNEDTDLWCLVMPLHRGHNVTAYLFSDLVCRSDTETLHTVTDVKFFTLHLHTRVFPTLCEDEYDQCSRVTCNAYVKQECQKSCGMCDAASIPRNCEYPQRFLGTWFLKDSFGYKRVHISRSNFVIDGMGNFSCVSFPNSAARKSTMFTTVSLYTNGCRPRYTCLKLHQLGPSVLQVSLSQSFVWPAIGTNLSSSICSESRFHADSLPIDDKYRPHEGAGKPIISQHPKPESVPCNLTFVHTVSATLREGYICSGSLYEHCDDPGKLRLDFDSCGTLVPASTDYRCLANFQGHYWERILLVQNLHDETDAVCFVFSQFYSSEAYVLVASQCDQKSFNFARTGLRKPILKLQFRRETETCRAVPVNRTLVSFPERHDGLLNSDASMRDESSGSYAQSNASRVISETDILSSSSLGELGQGPRKDSYNNGRDSLPVLTAKSTSFDGRNSFLSEYDKSSSKKLIPDIHWILVPATISALFFSCEPLAF